MPRIRTAITREARELLQWMLQRPYAQRWAAAHPRAMHCLYRRLTPHAFTGLPLTILVALFAYTIALLLGIVQDYLVHNPLIAVDIRIANLLSTLRSGWLLRTFATITLAAESIIIIAASGVLTILLIVRRQRAYLLGFWIALTTSEVVTFFGKIIFHRERPDILYRTIAESSFSFPSGHATTAAVFYGFLAYLIMRHRRSLRMRITTMLATVIIVLLVDASRLYLGVHYLSDVLAGNLVGLAGLLFAIGIMEWLVARERICTPEPFRWRQLLCILIVIGGMMGILSVRI